MEYDEEVNLEVTGAAATSCLKKRLLNLSSNATYSPSYCQAGAAMINIHLTLRTAPDLCKNVSLAVLRGSNDNSYTFYAQSDTCIYTHILPNIETLVGQKKYPPPFPQGKKMVSS